MARLATRAGFEDADVGLIFSLLWDRYRRLIPLIALHWGIDLLPALAAMFGITP